MIFSMNPDPSCEDFDDYVDPIPYLNNPRDPSTQSEPSYYDLSVETPEASTPIHSTPPESNRKYWNQSTEDLKNIISNQLEEIKNPILNVPEDSVPSSEFFESFSPESDLLLPCLKTNRTSLAMMMDNMFSDLLLKSGKD